MKRTTVSTVGIVVLATGLLVGDQSVRAGVADDDLSVVKRAVEPGSAARPVVGDETPRARKDGAPAQWLRVRVIEKRDGRRDKRVSVNLPLALVRAMGDFPIDLGCRSRSADEGHRCPKLRIADVLDALDKGQSLVEVDSDDATVRVWIE
jgi:hypothetical protein